MLSNGLGIPNWLIIGIEKSAWRGAEYHVDPRAEECPESGLFYFILEY